MTLAVSDWSVPATRDGLNATVHEMITVNAEASDNATLASLGSLADGRFGR